MNTFAKLAIAAAAVVAVAVIGINLLPVRGSVGGPSATPSPTPTSKPSASPSASPSPTPAAVFPPTGKLAVGRVSMIRGGVPLSINVPTSGWHSEQDFFINKDAGVTPAGASFLFWDPSPTGVYSDPCAHTLGPVVGPSTADLASAMSNLPGTRLVSGPSDVTVGGHPAKKLEITVREDVKCAAGDGGFYLWHRDIDNGEVRYATALGETLRLWIVDVDGTRLVIETETYKGAEPNAKQEIQKMVDSIQFE